MTEQRSDEQLSNILKNISDPSSSKQNINEQIENWDKEFRTSSNRKIGAGLVLVVAMGIVGAYFLHFLYQVKHECASVKKTPRVIAEVLLWIQVGACVILALLSIFTLTSV